jgi:integrase
VTVLPVLVALVAEDSGAARAAARARRSQARGLAPSSAALVFASSTGSPLAHSNFRNRVWLPALAAVGLEGIHLHDLRHTGNQLTANAGANPKELMARMGHDSERAALIYLHSTAERQRALADAVGDAARAELARSKKARRLSHRARNGHEIVVR